MAMTKLSQRGSTCVLKGCHAFLSFRELRHPNIVKFFGSNLQESSSGTKVMVILELCDCSLKTRIMSQPENAPARLEDVKVEKNVLLWALQILDALHYVHDKKFVHRDLKLDNLLVSINFFLIRVTFDRKYIHVFVFVKFFCFHAKCHKGPQKIGQRANTPCSLTPHL